MIHSDYVVLETAQSLIRSFRSTKDVSEPIRSGFKTLSGPNRPHDAAVSFCTIRRVGSTSNEKTLRIPFRYFTNSTAANYKRRPRTPSPDGTLLHSICRPRSNRHSGTPPTAITIAAAGATPTAGIGIPITTGEGS